MKPIGITTKIILILLSLGGFAFLLLSGYQDVDKPNKINQIPTPESQPTKTIKASDVDGALPKLAPTPTSIPSFYDDEIIDQLPTLEPLLVTPAASATPFKATNKTVPTELPAIQALDSLQRRAKQTNPTNENQFANSNVGFLTGNNRSTTSDQPDPQNTTLPEGALPLLSGQARGYAMLYMMHPKARSVVDAEIENLINARIQEVYIGVLVDGTFGKDHAYLQSSLKKLSDAGRIITLEQYLVSGPTMRRFETTPIKTAFSVLDPILFRSFYFYEPDIEQEILKVAKEARASFEYNTSLNRGNSNFVAVMLEDNLDSTSYRYMRNLVSREIGNTATFIRNACPDCYEGNDADTFGDPLELHPVDQFPELSEKDGYTLDGVDVMYPFDEKVSEVTVEDVRSMLSEASTKRLSFFGLWRRGRQGLGSSGQSQHPDERNYIVPTEEEKKLEIELLREGLAPAPE